MDFGASGLYGLAEGREVQELQRVYGGEGLGCAGRLEADESNVKVCTETRMTQGMNERKT